MDPKVLVILVIIVAIAASFVSVNFTGFFTYDMPDYKDTERVKYERIGPECKDQEKDSSGNLIKDPRTAGKVYYSGNFYPDRCDGNTLIEVFCERKTTHIPGTVEPARYTLIDEKKEERHEECAGLGGACFYDTLVGASYCGSKEDGGEPEPTAAAKFECIDEDRNKYGDDEIFYEDKVVWKYLGIETSLLDGNFGGDMGLKEAFCEELVGDDIKGIKISKYKTITTIEDPEQISKLNPKFKIKNCNYGADGAKCRRFPDPEKQTEEETPVDTKLGENDLACASENNILTFTVKGTPEEYKNSCAGKKSVTYVCGDGSKPKQKIMVCDNECVEATGTCSQKPEEPAPKTEPKDGETPDEAEKNGEEKQPKPPSPDEIGEGGEDGEELTLKTEDVMCEDDFDYKTEIKQTHFKAGYVEEYDINKRGQVDLDSFKYSFDKCDDLILTEQTCFQTGVGHVKRGRKNEENTVRSEINFNCPNGLVCVEENIKIGDNTYKSAKCGSAKSVMNIGNVKEAAAQAAALSPTDPLREPLVAGLASQICSPILIITGTCQLG